MAAIDLAGIRFRSYLPQFENDIADGNYAPVGPGNANIGNGIDLSAIKFRAWQQNDIASDQASGGDGGGQTGEGSGSGGGTGAPIFWPNDEILNAAPNEDPISSTITIIESEALITQNPNTSNISINDIITNAVPEEETVNGSMTASFSMTEIIQSEDTAYGFGLYGDGLYGE